MKKGKRIQSVTIKRMVDDSPDTSWLGEYANSPTSKYSIDRAHDLECPQQTYNDNTETIELLERAIAHLENVKDGEPAPKDDYGVRQPTALWEACDNAQDILIELQKELDETCTCYDSRWNSREYRYFNPSFNYVDKSDNLVDGNTAEDVIKYVQQDYERMERLNRGDWCFIGIRAEATIGIPIPADRPINPNCYMRQTITSGGLWGIESDSDREHLESVEKDELSELRSQLKALGFSTRAISKAFKTIERTDA